MLCCLNFLDLHRNVATQLFEPFESGLLPASEGAAVLILGFCIAGTVIGDLFSDPDPKLLLEVCLASLRLLYLMLQELCKLQQHLRVCTASYAMWIRQEPDGLCPQAIATPEEKKQRYVARRRQLASEVQQMKTCLGMCA